MAYREDLDMGKITLISVVSVLLTVALLLFLQVLYYGFLRRQLSSAKYNAPDAAMTKYVADQQGDLMSIRVVDRERQVATIPIDSAMELVVSQLTSDPSASVTGVADPELVADPAEPGEGGSEGGDEEESTGPGESTQVEEDVTTTSGDDSSSDSAAAEESAGSEPTTAEQTVSEPPPGSDDGASAGSDGEPESSVDASDSESGDAEVGGTGGDKEEESDNDAS